jgi:hypothetical protein
MARPYGLTEASCDRFSNAFYDRFERRRVKVTSHRATFLLRINVLGNSAFDQRIEASSQAKEAKTS